MTLPFRESRPARRRRQRGSAAVELALVLPILLLFLTFPIFYARCFWHYTVAQKAAQDAARYMSRLSRFEILSPALAADAVAVATQIATREMAELSPGSAIRAPRIYYDDVDWDDAGGTVPNVVRVRIIFYMVDTFFGVVDTGVPGLKITAEAWVPYVGS